MKRILSLLLVLLTVLQFLPATAVQAASNPRFSGELSAEQVSLEDGSVTVSLSGINGSQRVTAAFYGATGQLVGLGVQAPVAGTTRLTLRAALNGEAAQVRVFLTDQTTQTPVCESLAWKEPEASSAVAPLGILHSLPEIEPVGSVKPYDEYWLPGKNTVTEDLSDSPALAYSLTFGNQTTFAELPEGYDPDALLEWGKYPGLNMDILHQYGFTGKDSVVAYVDQPIQTHEQYAGVTLHYTNNTDSDRSMHGPAVLSLLAGKDIGTAPDAEVYYYAHASWEADQTTHAECLYQIIEQNKVLPEGEKITMVGFSDNIDSSEKNADALEKAVAACEEAGIMVWFCGEYGGATFLPYSNKNDYNNLVTYNWGTPDLVYVPASGRTSAATYGTTKYIYWGEGGLSWTMPYVLGLYGIAVEINPALTQNDLRRLIVDTAYDQNGKKIVNPVGFIAEVLTGVNRNAEAEAMLAEVNTRTSYLYAVMDTAALSEDDLQAIGSYLASITDSTVLVADAASFATAEELYTMLRDDAAARGGQVAGVQIFGTPAMVPAFQVQYKVQMPSDVDEGGMFLTDLFYGNFENDPRRIYQGYNVMDHFAEDWDVDLVPQWPVARLPLDKGEYAAFFQKYADFVADTGLTRRDLVNFSNPIFKSKNHVDDMGTFLNRMRSEFGLLNTPYRLYGNQLGQYPVTTSVLGGFTAENLAAENAAGSTEFLINSHGQWNNIDNCYYLNNEEIRASLINIDTINTVLDDHPYYLDCWTCNNGYGMQDNLTTTALNGQCVGMFSATTIISNNGVNCRASLAKMANSNFYYFYYHYLKALHEGSARGTAFYQAQQAYATALIADSVNGIRSGEGNYQFNLCNLLAYHNFGVLEPNGASAAFLSSGYMAQAGQSVPKEEHNQGGSSGFNSMTVTNGMPVGDAINLTFRDRDQFQTKSLTIHSWTAQRLDNGYIRFTVDYTSSDSMAVSAFNPPEGDVFMAVGSIGAGTGSLVYDVKEADVSEIQTITMKFNFVDDDCFFMFTNISQQL